MTEVLFYQLRRQPLEAVLPSLLERSLERGWRVVVQLGSNERAEAMDAHLWTYRDESFLPHGLDTGDSAAMQPVLLTADDGNGNAANVRFVVDNAAPAGFEGYDRIVIIFDGGDPDRLAAAREWWKGARSEGHDVSFWEQGENSGWQKRA